jgi:hypothetical protein
MEPRLQSSRTERLVMSMNMIAVPGAANAQRYAQLQRDIRDALRAQHPEWIQPNGDCPTCDSYERRLAELLRLSNSGR